MEFVVQPWHWFVLGILLILSELILPAFAALWFGIAAIMVCFLYWLFPDISLTTQIVLWIVLSVLCTILWFKFIKPLSIDKTKAGLPREATIGQIGMVIQTNLAHDQIIVRFPNQIYISCQAMFCRKPCRFYINYPCNCIRSILCRCTVA